MLRLKRGVNLSGLCPELVLAITGTCVPVFQLQGEDCTVTSGDDSRHSITSLHYAGRAVDIRSKNLTQIGKETALAQIKAALGATSMCC